MLKGFVSGCLIDKVPFWWVWRITLPVGWALRNSKNYSYGAAIG